VSRVKLFEAVREAGDDQRPSVGFTPGFLARSPSARKSRAGSPLNLVLVRELELGGHVNQ